MRNIPGKGDRVRVSDEGTVICVSPMAPSFGRTRLTVRRDDGSTFFVGVNPGMKQKVEAIEQPLVVGGIYKDKDGDVFRYNGTGDPEAVWTEFSDNYSDGEMDWREDYAAKPLRRLDGARG